LQTTKSSFAKPVEYNILPPSSPASQPPMSQPPFPGDLHAVRQAVQAGELQAQDILAQAALAAQSQACRHAFMPGSPQYPATPPKNTLTGNAGPTLAGIRSMWRAK